MHVSDEEMYMVDTAVLFVCSTMNRRTRRIPIAQRFRAVIFVTVLSVLIGLASGRRKKPVLRDGLFKGSKFQQIKSFSDEFRGRFDKEKWYQNNPRWLGRQPGLFAAKNVKQRRGRLMLFGRYEKDDEAFKDAPEGYERYTTAFVQTKKNAKYGYFEVKAKPSNSRLSSSFWGSLDTPERWTEIDVFELGGGAINDEGVDFRKRINMNLHVFRDKKRGIQVGKNEISKPTFYTHGSYLRSKFHTYGLDWNKRWITWTFNGQAIRRDRNRYWHQGFPMKFDVETMAYWFGLPSRKTLPAVYKIKYIRAWSRIRRGADSVQVVQSSGRQFWPVGWGNSGIIQHGGGDEEEDDDDDDAVMQVDSEKEVETGAPRDGLQRPPIGGSNEKVYRAVVPPSGEGRWTRYIEEVNQRFSDVAGTMGDVDEIMDRGDLDEAAFQ